MGKKIPEPLEHAVAAIMKKQGVSRQEAYAIVTKQWQRYGLIKKGSHKLTKKGRSKLSKHYKEPKKVRLRKINMARKHKKKRI
ncbi:MAG: hypothetical protein DRG27_06270 [Deltaproteobacteria bacterium]|nr:MAG: hypothetical protein DRG27_06270 [Deltaproteobacteria bacterium]